MRYSFYGSHLSRGEIRDTLRGQDVDYKRYIYPWLLGLLYTCGRRRRRSVNPSDLLIGLVHVYENDMDIPKY